MTDLVTTYQTRAEKILARAAAGDIPQHLIDDLNTLIEDAIGAGRADGMHDLALDLWDAREVTDETVEFMIENNGVPDPRKR